MICVFDLVHRISLKYTVFRGEYITSAHTAHPQMDSRDSLPAAHMGLFQCFLLVAEIEINIDFLQHFGLLQLAWAAWAAEFAQ